MGKRIVIIGGGAAGASAAARARRLDPEAEIVMLDKGLFISHAPPCGIPYYIGGVVKEAQELAIYTPEEFAKERRITVKVNAEVFDVDTKNQVVYARRVMKPLSISGTYS